MRYIIIVNKHNLQWRKNYKFHRLFGTAEECYNGAKAWCKDGQIHRLDGPAVEYENGEKVWCIDGIYYTEEEFNKMIKK